MYILSTTEKVFHGDVAFRKTPRKAVGQFFPVKLGFPPSIDFAQNMARYEVAGSRASPYRILRSRAASLFWNRLKIDLSSWLFIPAQPVDLTGMGDVVPLFRFPLHRWCLVLLRLVGKLPVARRATNQL